MSDKEYKLSRTLYGHSLDVRSVVATSKDDVVSGSRDKTAKFWKRNEFQNSFEDVMTFRNHKNFVGSVLCLEPTEEYPEGLVVTGGYDNLILIFKPSEPFPTFTIQEHSNTVCCLNNANELNAFLSGSWDCTAKYFRISEAPKCTVTFIGHQASVWSVIHLKDLRVVTASADKTIGVWDSTGQKLQSLTGHTDCVRSLADFPDLGHFVSVANDAAIKVWTYSGENIATYYGHENYIYSIARCKSNGPDAFVTSGEDCTVRCWQNGENTQTIRLPAQSIWTITCLSNGDIVAGSSDAVIRIFTQDESRVAEEQALIKFNEEVNALKKQTVQEIGGVKVSDLPGREALYDPGKRAGQMKMIREGGGVVAYTWVQEGNNSHWEKVGDVMGGTDKDSTGKTVYEGKAYDFVFSVDVEDGKPPIKLPYNRGDDVYQTAHAFLTKNMLPAEYLEQVVDFILKNSKEQYVPLIVQSLTKCLRKNSKLNPSDPDYVNAFDKCKELMTNSPVLAYPDFSKPFRLTTDASNVAIGSVLSQNDHPIAFYSRTLNSAERNYSTIEKEFLSIVEATKHFRPYLYGQKFLIETDHNPLVWDTSLKEPNSRLTRWKLKLEEFNFDIKYKKGKDNKVADALSRIQINTLETESNIPNNDINDTANIEDFDNNTVHSDSGALNVVDFILKNSKEQYVPPSTEYQDPFTGGNRYAPSYSNTNESVGANLDPFTGGSSYSTGTSKSATATAGADPFTGSSSYTTIAQPAITYFPVLSYRTFDTGDTNVILNKLKEFNEKAGSSNLNVSNDDMESLVKICAGPSDDINTFQVLLKLLDWPEDIVFPVLDIVRMAVRHPKNNEAIALANKGVILEKLKTYINSSVPNNTIIALRTLCNFCAHPTGESLIYERRFDILEGITSLGQLNKNGQIALSTLLLNITILSIKNQDEVGFSVLAQVLPDILTKLTDPESHFRGYVALGTLITSSNSQKQELVIKINENSNFLTTLQLHGFGGGSDLEKKRTNCVKQLQGVLL